MSGTSSTDTQRALLKTGVRVAALYLAHTVNWCKGTNPAPRGQLPRRATAGNMEAMDSTQAVLNALSPTNVDSIRFSIRGIAIAPHDYDQVRRMVASGRIFTRQAQIKTGGPISQARYNPATDTMSFPGGGFSHYTAQALIVHEATHAILDARGVRGISVAVSEAIAYTAQLVVFHVHMPGVVAVHRTPVSANLPAMERRRIKRSNDELKIFRAAIPVAKSVFEGKGAPVFESELLVSTIPAAKIYAGAIWKTVDFNGVP